MKRVWWVIGAVALGALVAAGAIALDGRGLPDPIGYPEYDIGARVEAYSENAGRTLHLHILEPDVDDAVGAVVFFHGARGNPGQFEGQATALRNAGMVAILVEYTTGAEGASTADTVAQGRTAVQWVRAHAADLGIDPHRIAVAGASAGGRIAVGTMEPADTGEVRAAADALVLFNPAVSSYPAQGRPAPPTLVFHGEADRQVSVETAQGFCASVGTACSILTYPGGGHGFFNTDPEYSATLEATITFLRELGWTKVGVDR